MKGSRLVTLLGLVALVVVTGGCREESQPAVVVKTVPPEPLFQIKTVDFDDSPVQIAFDELRLKVLAYDIKAPYNHRVSIWREVWIDGKLDQGLSEGLYYQPTGEQMLSERVIFSFMNGESMDSPKSRWSIRQESLGPPDANGKVSHRGSSGGVRWIDDPLRSPGIKVQGAQSFHRNAPIERGKTYTLHMIGASRGSSIEMDEKAEPSVVAASLSVAIFLRARIERVPTANLKQGGTFGRTDVPPALLEDAPR